MVIDEQYFKTARMLGVDPLDLPKALSVLMFYGDEDVRYQVAMTSGISSFRLHHLADDECENVRCAVAYNMSTSPKTLEKLADDECEDVRRAVAYNRSTSPKTLEKLADDECEDVRRVVGVNENTQEKTLLKLACDKSEKVRLAVAKNRKKLRSVFKKLRNDESLEVRKAVSLNAEQQFMEYLLIARRERAAFYREHLEMFLFNKFGGSSFSKSEDDDVREAVAEDWNTPIRILKELADDKSERVRLAVAKNRSMVLYKAREILRQYYITCHEE